MAVLTSQIAREIIETAKLPKRPARARREAKPPAKLKSTDAQALVVGSSLVVAAENVRLPVSARAERPWRRTSPSSTCSRRCSGRRPRPSLHRCCSSSSRRTRRSSDTHAETPRSTKPDSGGIGSSSPSDWRYTRQHTSGKSGSLRPRPRGSRGMPAPCGSGDRSIERRRH